VRDFGTGGWGCDGVGVSGVAGSVRRRQERVYVAQGMAGLFAHSCFQLGAECLGSWAPSRPSTTGAGFQFLRCECFSAGAAACQIRVGSWMFWVPDGPGVERTKGRLWGPIGGSAEREGVGSSMCCRICNLYLLRCFTCHTAIGSADPCTPGTISGLPLRF
jgi:hypothetical protein